MTRRAPVILLVLAALALGAAACGGGDDDGGGNGSAGGGGGGGSAVELTLAADPNGELKFDKTELQATAGEVTINFTNEASIPHNVSVEGNGVDETSDTISGDTTSLTVGLEAGTYTFYCGVGNHRSAGMEGTLTVE
jgi:plastocyanin